MKDNVWALESVLERMVDERSELIEEHNRSMAAISAEHEREWREEQDG